MRNGTCTYNDPKMIYDPVSDRWFATVGPQNISYFAASTSGDPTKPWKGAILPFPRIDPGMTIGYFSQDVGEMSGRSAVAEVMDGAAPGGLGGTYAGNPLAIAAAHAVIDVMAEERLPERGAELGARLKAELVSVTVALAAHDALLEVAVSLLDAMTDDAPPVTEAH